MIQVNNTSSHISVPVVLIALVALFLPYVNIMYVFFPVKLIGKNFWLVAPMLVMFGLYLATLFESGGTVKKHDLILFFIAIVTGFIFLSRELLYMEQRSFIDIRYIFSPIIFLLVFKKFVHGEKNLNRLRFVLIATCFFQALLGIFHTHFFPEINISIDPDNAQSLEIVFNAGRTREGGTLGASIYANVIVCGMFLLLSLNAKLTSSRANILLIISTLVMVYAVSLSGSRYPMIVSALIALVLFSKFFSNVKQGILLLCACVTLAILFYLSMGGFELYSIIRLEEDSGGRWGKFILPLSLLAENILHLFIGVPDAIVNSSFTDDGYLMSDNSYMLIATAFGLFLLLGYLFFLIGLLKKNISDKLSFCFFMYVVIGLGLTNCILWEPWVFFAMLISTMLYHGKLLSLNHYHWSENTKVPKYRLFS